MAVSGPEARVVVRAPRGYRRQGVPGRMTRPAMTKLVTIRGLGYLEGRRWVSEAEKLN